MSSFKGGYQMPQMMGDDADSGKQQNTSSPLLKRYKVDFTPDEPITHLVAGHDQVVIATKDKRVLIVDTKTSEQSSCDISRYYGSRLSQIKIHKLFLDPTGKFLLISVAQATDNQPYENLLYHRQLQSLQRLKNHLITAVAWNYPRYSNPSAAASLQSASSFNETNSTGTILLGTSKGLVLQTEFSHSDETRFFPLKTGPGHYVKEVFDVGAEAGSITGIAYYQIYNSNLGTEKSFVVLLSTSNRLYRMVGNVPSTVDPPSLQLIINQNATNYKEVPGRFTNSKLDLYYPQTPNSLPTRFAWLTEPGVMTSELHDQYINCRASFESSEEINIIPYSNPEEAYFPLSSSTPTGGGGFGSLSPQFNILTGSYYDKPISMVVTNFHVIVLMRHCIRAICILNNLTVYEEYFSTNYGDIQGMCKDPHKNVVWVYFKRAVFRYKIPTENKNVWKIFLDQKRFDLAKKYSIGDHDNYDRVICEEAQHYFNLKDYERSAELFACSKKPFEDVALMFMDASCSRALKKYLMIKLDEFDVVTTQFTMTLSWLFEVIISSISVLETTEKSHDNDRQVKELDELYGELEELLESGQVIECLKQHRNVFYSIIQNYASWRVHIRVAKLIGDHEQLIRAYMYSRDYSEALSELRATRRPELFYIHGHLLMKHKPKEMVDALIRQPGIDPSKLIAILIQENPYYNKCCETIRYLEHCVYKLKADCKVIHNYLFELYARYRDEETLIGYLDKEISSTDEQSNCYLDLQACLRISTSLKLPRTCVKIYSHMGLYDEAVNLALKLDVSLAKNIANCVESEDHQKRLWLSIAKSVLGDKADIHAAAELLEESKLLKIEDVLVFFPDYKTVDSIEAALHQSLEAKRNEIMSIRDGTYEMIGNEIRKEIRTFKVRYSKVKCGQKCEICSRNIMSRSSYLFPCGHVFHYDCVIKEMLSINPQHKGIEDKLRRLAADSGALVTSLSQTASATLAADKQKIADELHEIVSEECLYCGGFLANCIHMPAFTDPNSEYPL